MRVLIVEDEVRLAETLRDLLDTEHYAADVCHDGESGLDNALSDIYDLVILDVMLPKKDGFSVLRALRQEGKTVPVLMLSARSELSDRVEGLDCGADYYLTKPFEPKELLACVRMLTRRQPEQRASNVKLWGYESDAEDNNVEVYISFLRKKLEHLRSRVKIRTIRMVGYRLEQEA